MNKPLSILRFTQAAQQHIESVIAKNAGANSYRLSVKKTGCNGYMYVSEVVSEPKKNTDIILNDCAAFSVFVCEQAVEMIKGTTVDYVEKSFGMRQLVFINPNIAGECGCGESFNLKENEASDE